MNISTRWLREWVDPDVSDLELSEKLTMAGLEVDQIAPVAPPFEGLVVGHVVACGKHPNADKLSLCEVDVGTGENLQIICGAPNVRQDLKVAVATVGSVLPNGLKIKRAKLRGVESNGMLCSESEIGISEAHDGIIELDSKAKIGNDVRSVLDLDDQIIELDITPNRGDCFSVLGVAREVCVNFDLSLPALDFKVNQKGNQSNAIEDPNNAVKHTHQMAIAIDTLMKIVTDVELESDPVYLQKRRYQIGKSYGIDELIGFPPNCTLEALTINPETTAEKVKLEQAKPISGDGEIHIVDGVQYQIEGQILKVYTGDSKMKPLNRHMGGLMMKCGSGLITGKKKDWLSFVSSESNDIKKARNQNCHYQYFQKSKDSEAFDLFNAISSSTDSILDQLEKI